MKSFISIIFLLRMTILMGCSPNIDNYVQAMDNPEKFKALLSDVKNINKQDKNKQTLLMIAMNNNKPKIVEILLDTGADPFITDGNGNILFWAIYNKSYDSIRMLFKKRPELER